MASFSLGLAIKNPAVILMDVFDTLVLTLPEGATQAFTLSKASVMIGRATTNDIVLRDGLASRFHARVERVPGGYQIIDLGSANGTEVNGQVISRVMLKPADLLTLGDSVLRFEAAAPEPEPDATRMFSQEDIRAGTHASLPVELVETALPRVAIHTEARTWEALLLGDSLTIGRHPSNDIVLDYANVSRHHAVFERKRQSFFVRDLQSDNGTRLRGQRISVSAVDDGDTVQIGPAQLVFKRGFGGDDLTVLDTPSTRRSRRPVVVVPGFGGSVLWRGSERIWPSPRMVLAHPELLRIDQPLEARGLVNEVVIVPNLLKQEQYSALTDYLKESLLYEAGKDLLEFGYDFRQDNRASARQLGAAIDAWDVGEPVTIVAHSMGCLVARYYIECLGGRDRVERVVYLGGPHAGTPYAFASLMRGPDMLPLGLMNAKLRDVLANYPSWYQILPTYSFASARQTPFEALVDESWVADAQRGLLKQAREFRAELGGRSSVPSVCVFGYGIKTITEADIVRDAAGLCQNASLVVTPRGDGTIPETSSVLAGAEIHPVKQHHGSLYGDTDVKMRLKLELARGTLS